MAVMHYQGFEHLPWLTTIGVLVVRIGSSSIMPANHYACGLDIIPTEEAFRRTNMASGPSCWHWFSLTQPYPVPERLIGANPNNFYFRQSRETFRPAARGQAGPSRR